MRDILAMLSAVTAVTALHLPALATTSLPVSMAQCTAGLRCAPICAQIGDDDSANDDLMREAQRRHFELSAELNCGETVESFTRSFEVNPVRPLIGEERRRRSPGISNNFYDSSTEDFIKPWSGAGATSPAPDALPDSDGESGDPARIRMLATRLDALLESTPDNCDGDDCTLWDQEEEKE
jgi:hypothetical protein